jgi:hypothetical protein
VATSYANTGGTGNRTAIITVTATGFAGDPNVLVNGDLVTNTIWFNNMTELRFEFSGFKKIIDEAKFYQQLTTSHGTWKWQGGDDGSSWTDIGSSFALGGSTTQTITALAGNTAEYKFYRMVRVSGATSSSPYVYEFEFKLEDGTAIVTEPRVSQLVVEAAELIAVAAGMQVSQLVVEAAQQAAAAGIQFSQMVVEAAQQAASEGVQISQLVVEVASPPKYGETAIIIFD